MEKTIDKTNIIGYGGRDKNIKIPDGVTTISSYAFNDSKIESITFNKELKRIESKIDELNQKIKDMNDELNICKNIELHEEKMNKNLDKYESEMNENERIK